MLTVGVHTIETESTTWTVDDDGPADFSSIQDAINAASLGDTIFVYNGTYYEHIIVNKTVTLIGENKRDTIIDGNKTGTVVTVVSNDVNIHGFTMTRSGSTAADMGIHLDGTTGCNITDNIIQGNYEGIRLTDSSGNIIGGNIVKQNRYFNGIHLMYSTDNILSGNIVLINHMGIYLQYSHQNTINGNIAAQNRVGIYLSHSGNNIINANTLTDNPEFGILLLDSRNNILKNNNLTNNKFNLGVWGSFIFDFIQNIDTSNIVNNRPVYYWVNEHDKPVPPDAGYVGIINSTNIAVKDLTLTENGEGVLFAYTKNSIIENVNISKCWSGIYLFQSADNLIRGNRVEANLYFNIDLLYSSRNTIYHNNFLGYIMNQISNIDSYNSWDNGAEGNYWIDYSGEDENGDGIGDTPYIIDDYNQDNFPLMNQWPSHDIAIIEVAPYKTIVGKNYSVPINVTIVNQGHFNEAGINVNLFADPDPTVAGDEIQIDPENLEAQNITLAIREFKTVQFIWDTIDLDFGSYTIIAVLDVVLNEIDIEDNNYTDRTVFITLPGDVNGDRTVDIFDMVYVSAHWYPGPPMGPLGYDANADINSDGAVDILDIDIISVHWGETW